MDRRKLLKLTTTTALAPLAWLLGKPTPVVSTEETPPPPSEEYHKGWNDALKHHPPCKTCEVAALQNFPNNNFSELMCNLPPGTQITDQLKFSCTIQNEKSYIVVVPSTTPPAVSNQETNPCKELPLPTYHACEKEGCTKEECNGCRDWYDGPTQCRWITPTGDPDYSSNSAARIILEQNLQAPNVVDQIHDYYDDCDGCCEDCHGCQDAC